tara:strand:- start:1939 stop:2859 length:921 start_codon:yes stop_codon:yes gene_type:complete
MVKLKDLINEIYAMTPMKHDEWYPAHTRDALQWTLTQNYVPIYPKTMETIIGKVPVDAFHVTDPQRIKTLKDILGKKKSISTFNAANKTSQLAKGRGVQTGSGGVIFHVEGLLLAQKGMDFDTVPDRTGRRWVQGHQIFGGNDVVRKAIKKAKLPDYSEWREIENKVVYEVEDDPKNKDLRFSQQTAIIKKKLGPIVQKHIKKYIDTTNKLLKSNKKKVMANLTNPSTDTSVYWNEILIYNVKVKDVFVMKRVWDDYYFQNDSGYDNPVDSYKKDLLSYVDEKDITIGTPAQFRKWYTAREGEITV